jgi:nucleotide-binding universal stress UspA family protein
MTHGGTRPVLVGFDGSASSRHAVDLGLAEARLRGLPLRVVHAFEWPVEDVFMVRGRWPTSKVVDDARSRADTWFAREVASVADGAPDVDVSGVFEEVPPARLLVDASREAELVVLGSRGLGGFAGVLLGSVGQQVASHAASPVLVHRAAAGGEETPDAGRVVVGVDGSPAGETALHLAFEEAAMRGVALEAVHAWHLPAPWGPGDPWAFAPDAEVWGQEAHALLGEALAGFGEKFPDVPVIRRVIRERPSPALLDAARHASLVVVGSRGHGGFTGLLLGSTDHALLHHAPCPVLVAR